jgi:hypothetical protein
MLQRQPAEEDEPVQAKPAVQLQLKEEEEEHRQVKTDVNLSRSVPAAGQGPVCLSALGLYCGSLGQLTPQI